MWKLGKNRKEHTHIERLNALNFKKIRNPDIVTWWFLSSDVHPGHQTFHCEKGPGENHGPAVRLDAGAPKGATNSRNIQLVDDGCKPKYNWVSPPCRGYMQVSWNRGSPVHHPF